MTPDLESLRCFVAAARQLHFGAAARSVALSAPAFGARIRALEQVLDAPLFTRTTRKVQLTEAGRRLLPHAEACLRQVADCARVVSHTARIPVTLTIGTRYELGMSFVLPLLDQITAAHPERTFHLRFGDTGDLIPRLRGGEVDAVITSARLTASGLQYLPLHEERYAFVAAPALLRKLPLDRPSDAGAHTLLDTLPELPLFRYMLDVTPSADLWRFAAVRHLGTIAAVRARALGGRGVAVLPEYFVRDDLAKRRLVRLMRKTVLPTDWFRLVYADGHPGEGELVELAARMRARPLR